MSIGTDCLLSRGRKLRARLRFSDEEDADEEALPDDRSEPLTLEWLAGADERVVRFEDVDIDDEPFVLSRRRALDLDDERVGMSSYVGVVALLGSLTPTVCRCSQVIQALGGL